MVVVSEREQHLLLGQRRECSAAVTVGRESLQLGGDEAARTVCRKEVVGFAARLELPAPCTAGPLPSGLCVPAHTLSGGTQADFDSTYRGILRDFLSVSPKKF